MEFGDRDFRGLVSQAKLGNVQAFGQIYDLLIDRIYRFIHFRIDSKEDSEDLTEQVFLKAWEGLKSYEDWDLPFQAWIFRVARNLVIDYYRTKKKQVCLEEAAELEDKGLTPEELTGLRMTQEMVLKEMRNLPDSYQEIIVLKFIEERENKEISRILDKPVDQVRVLQSRALKSLRGLLDEKECWL